MNKLKAFTLTEVMIVLALTGMVVAIGCYVWFTFESFGSGYRQTVDVANEWNNLHHALTLDAQRSIRVEAEGQGMVLWREDSVLGAYWMSLPQALVRKEESRIDSFHIANLKLHVSHRFDADFIQLLTADSLLPDTLFYPLPSHAEARNR